MRHRIASLFLLLCVVLGSPAAGQTPESRGHEKSISDVAFSPTGDTLASTAFDGTLRLWDAATGKLRRTIRVGTEGNFLAVEQVAFAPDGKSVLTGSMYQNLRLWDVGTGVERRAFDGYSCVGGCSDIAFSPDGRSIAGADSSARNLRLWDAATGEVRRSFLLPVYDERLDLKASADHIAFSPDGSRLITADQSVVRVWSVASGGEVLHFDPEGVIEAMALSPDGKTLATGGWREGRRAVLQMWDAATGRLLRRFPEQQFGITAVAFSPDGRTLAEAHPEPSGGGYIVRLWDATSGKRLRTLSGHTADVTALAFAPDGKRLVSGSDDTTLIVWDVQRGERARCLPQCPVRDQPSKKTDRIAGIKW